MKFTQYLQSREIGFLPNKSKFKSRLSAETLIEKQSVQTIKNLPCKLSGQTRATFLVDFSNDRSKVASTHGDHTVRVSDIVSGKCTHVLVGHPRTPWCLAFHPSSNDILASGCLGGEVRIWDLLGGGSEVWHAPNGTVIASLTFHPTDHVLLFATANSVYFWDWSQPEPFAICQTNYEYERVRWLGFDPLGHYIYTGITNVTTIHRDDPPVIHIRDRTGHHPNSRLRSNWPRYQHLVERFHSYQRGRTRNRFDEMEEDGADIPTRPLSPVHIEGINLARQFAAEVTATSQASTSDRSQLRSAQQPVPINYLWDINEDGMEARSSFSRDPESPIGRPNNTDEELGSSDITLPSPLRQYFTDPRTRDWSPPPRVSNDEVDSFVDDEIERFRSVLRQPESRFRSRYATRPSHQSRSDRSQRRLAIFSEFMRRRGRNPDGSRMNNNSASTRSRGYLFERGLDRLERSSVTNTNSNEFTPRLIDRLNENIDLTPSSTSATSTSSTTTLPSIFSTIPRVSTGFPPARITGLSQNHFGSRFSSISTPETATANSFSSDSSSRSTLSIAQALTTSIQNSLLGRSSEDAELETESTSSNLVVQRQSDESNSLELPSTTTSAQSLNSSTSTVTSSSTSTLFVDQPLAAPRGNTEENSCSRTRPPYRGLDRGGLPSSISRLRRQLADCRTSRQRMLRHSRLQLSRTPQPESFRNPLNPRPTELPVTSHSRNQHLSRFLASTISNSLFSPNLDVTTSSSIDSTPRPSVLQRHWSPPGDTRTILTDQTSQTSGTMTEPEYTDQGTDVVGLNLDVELTHDDVAVDDASEDTSYLLYDSDTITDSSLTIDLSDEAAPTDHEDLHIPMATENYLNSLDSSHDIITLENLSYRNEDAELEPVTSLDESVVSTSTTSLLSGLNDSLSATSDLASVSSLCQFVNHYNQSSPINITSSLTDTLNTSTTMTAEPSDEALDSTPAQLVSTASITVTPEGEGTNLLSSLGLTPTSLGVSNTVVVSSTPENDQGLEENAASIADSASVTSNASVSNNSGGSPPSLPDDDSTNNCPAHTVLRHHAYLANATARLERRISELDQRIGRSNSAISSSSLNNREDLASITARLERQVSELDHRINALRQSFTERLRALHQDRDRILSMRGRLSGEPERSVPSTTTPSALPRITITRAGDETNDDADLTFQPTTQAESRRNGRTLLESFLRYESSASQNNNASNTTRRLRNPSEPPINRGSEDESWHSLQQIHLHPHYSSSILDDTINRPNDALQAAINRAIAGAFMGTGESAVANNIVPQSHRIQWWDFRQYQVPDLKNSKSNIVVPVCKLHNDASCDISQDGTRLATFVPSHRGFPDDNILAVFSLQTHNFSHCLFTKSFGPNAISVSISPRNDHVLIGLAAKRLSWVFTTHQLVGQIYHLKEPHAGEESMKHVTDVFHTCDSDVRTHVSVNSARWLPRVGEGIVYGTNRGDLVICRPSAKTVTQKAEVLDTTTIPATESENTETLTETRMNLLNLFQTTTPQTSTAATQTISRGIRRTAGTQTLASTSQDDGFREPFIV